MIPSWTRVMRTRSFPASLTEGGGKGRRELFHHFRAKRLSPFIDRHFRNGPARELLLPNPSSLILTYYHRG